MDKTVWVTGASRGIGKAIAFALAGAGAQVCFGARNPEQIQQMETLLRQKGCKAHGFVLDVSQWDSVVSFCEKAVEASGLPDILVNNAGSGLFQDLDMMSPEVFNHQIDVNLKGPWFMMRNVVPFMKKLGGGTIINISSLAGTKAFKRGTAYCAAKAGLNMMGECLMIELREFGIRMVTVAPGSVDTGFVQNALPLAHNSDQSWMLEPETIAQSCLHLLTQPEGALVSYYEIRPNVLPKNNRAPGP